MTAVGKGKDGMKEGKESAHGSGQQPEGKEGKESAQSAASSGQQPEGKEGKERACRADMQGPADRGSLCIMDARGTWRGTAFPAKTRAIHEADGRRAPFMRPSDAHHDRDTVLNAAWCESRPPADGFLGPL